MTALWNASGVTPERASRKILRAVGNQYVQNARPRATAFSQSRDCDSCIPRSVSENSRVLRH